ncbi:carbonic anhydrase [bacterium]|nr:carbonic anhydrase [bacterium]
MIEPKFSYDKALEYLIAGNERFQKNELTHVKRIDGDTRNALIMGQSPIATILTCSDSRVPPQHIFDSGLGELFICRNAGNILGVITLGSIEYAVEFTFCPLIMVMGHNRCGAVTSASKVVKDPELSKSHNIDEIVRRLIPALLSTKDKAHDEENWIALAAKKNVENTCFNILKQSKIIHEKIKAGIVGVVGAWYDLESGKVEILVPLERLR